MSVGPINLLPDVVIQELHQDKTNREKKYYLSALALSLVGITIMGLSINSFYTHATEEAEELIVSKKERLEQLNGVWNDVIILETAVKQVDPIQDDGVRIAGMFGKVIAAVDGITLGAIERESSEKYRVSMISETVEESNAFVALLQSSFIPEAIVRLETIQEREDEVRFTVTIRYPEEIFNIYER